VIARCATLLFLLSVTGFAQDPARLDQVAQSYATNNHFNGTVLVAKGDQVLLSKGYGSANLEWNIPNTPSTKFRLGSVTKQFTAASILLLEERDAFKGVGPGGADFYQVKFEKGSLDYRIWLTPDGKTDNANVRPSE
jgi:hypothetical protein